MPKTLISWNGRPCEVGGSRWVRHKNPAWGSYSLTTIRYVDGLQPATDEVAPGKLRAAKALRGAEEAYWLRVSEYLDFGLDRDKAIAAAREALGIKAWGR